MLRLNGILCLVGWMVIIAFITLSDEEGCTELREMENENPDRLDLAVIRRRKMGYPCPILTIACLRVAHAPFLLVSVAWDTSACRQRNITGSPPGLDASITVGRALSPSGPQCPVAMHRGH